MALINCRECGKEISNQAVQCIHCGCPIEKEKRKVIMQIDNNSNIIDEASGITQVFVYIDGNFVGEFKKDNQVLTTELTIGEHEFSLELKAGLPRGAGLLFAIGHVPVVDIETSRKKKIIITGEYEITKIFVGRDDEEITVSNYNINENITIKENETSQSTNLLNENIELKTQIHNLENENKKLNNELIQKTEKDNNIENKKRTLREIILVILNTLRYVIGIFLLLLSITCISMRNFLWFLGYMIMGISFLPCIYKNIKTKKKTLIQIIISIIAFLLWVALILIGAGYNS